MSLRLSEESQLTKSAYEFSKSRKDPAFQSWISKGGPGLSSQSQHIKPDKKLPPHPDFALKGADPVKRIEDHISSGHLHELKARFNAADKDGSGALDLTEFISMFDKLFGWTGNVKNEEQIEAFFMKIDYNSDGLIDWDEFCTYMQLELREKEDAELRQKEVTFHLPANIVVSPHKDTMCRIRSLHDGTLVSCSQDGIISFWTENLEQKRLRKSEMSVRGRPKWITDMAICNTYGKIILTTGDKEIQFFELVNFEPYCQLCQLDTTPLKMDFWSNPKDCHECMLVYGDNVGCVNVLVISHLQEAFNFWKRGPKMNGSPSMTLDSVANDPDSYTKYYRWKTHPDWVQWVRYISGLRAVLSCCSDPDTALIVGSPQGSTQVEQALREPVTLERSASVYIPARRSSSTSNKLRPKSAIPARSRVQSDQKIFKVPKGVAMFDYSDKHKIIATGGMDQIVRVWNPFVSNKPIEKLYGHISPILFLAINDRYGHIYTISFDNCIKVWDLVEYTCVISVTSGAHKVLNTVDVAYFNQAFQCIALANEQMAVLKLVPHSLHHEEMIKTHLLPVVAVEYSTCFKQVLTACEESVIKVWDIDTGMKAFEFCNVHDDSPITTIMLDETGRKLVTGGQDGKIKIWNYNNGSCIRIMDKGTSDEITSVIYATVNLNRYVIGVGWDKEINIFIDVTDSVYQVQTPISVWKSISRHTHTDDILSVAYGEPYFLATSSFDGEIIIWNIISSYIFCKMKAPVPKEITNCIYLEGDMAVSQLIFLNTRSRQGRHCANLVANGPAGCVHFWNVNNSSSPAGYWVATEHHCITAMSTNDSYSTLVTADVKGYVTLWNIENYCMDGRSPKNPPKKLQHWRAHVQPITSVKMVDDKDVLLTSSEDCSARLWTTKGHYIGTFGQHQLWNIKDHNTYMHPFIPGEILTDPSSLPKSMQSSAHHDQPSEVKPKPATSIQMKYSNHLNKQEEEAEIIKSVSLPGYTSEEEKLVGKRLRHERTHQECGIGTAYSYKTLKCFAMEESEHTTMQRPPKRPAGFLDF